MHNSFTDSFFSSASIFNHFRSSGPMPKAVRKALELACINHGEMDQDQAQRFLLKLEKEGRWREECWT